MSAARPFDGNRKNGDRGQVVVKKIKHRTALNPYMKHPRPQMWIDARIKIDAVGRVVARKINFVDFLERVSSEVFPWGR